MQSLYLRQAVASLSDSLWSWLASPLAGRSARCYRPWPGPGAPEWRPGACLASLVPGLSAASLAGLVRPSPAGRPVDRVYAADVRRSRDARPLPNWDLAVDPVGAGLHGQ